MKKYVLQIALYVATIFTIPAYAIIRPTNCRDTSTTCNAIDNGQLCHTPCYTCDMVETGCQCARECDLNSQYKCVCNDGYHSSGSGIFCECAKDCATGYYGDGTTCAPCPAPGTTNGYTQFISGCFVPKNTNVSDSTGTYQFTSNCVYSGL